MATAAISSTLDATRRRRAAYHRSHTISLLPEESPIPEIDNELDEEVAHINECSKLIRTPEKRSTGNYGGGASYNATSAFTRDKRDSGGDGNNATSAFARVDELAQPVVRPKEILQKSPKVHAKSPHVAKHGPSTQRLNDRTVVDPKCICKPDVPSKHAKQEPRKIPKKKENDFAVIPEISISGKARAMEFQKRRSITISTDEPLLPPSYDPGRKSPFPSLSPTTAASSMLNKFKERIQQSLFLSSESQGAALLHQRRERANQYVKKAMRQQHDLDFETIRLKDLSKKNKRRGGGHKDGSRENVGCSEDELHLLQKNIASDPGGVYTGFDDVIGDVTGNDGDDDTLPPEVEMANARAAKEAFRRRSISEDVYDRLPHTYILERHAITASASACINSGMSSKSNSGGIVCSDDDLQFILNTFSKHDKPSANSDTSSLAKDTADNAIPTIVEEEPNSQTVTKSTDHFSKVDPSGLSKANATKHKPISATDKTKQCDISSSREDNGEPPEQPPEIIFDEHGQTWDVYGAEFDPEILGDAIQKHLEKLMTQMTKKHLSPQSTISHEDNGNKDESRNNGSNRTWWKMLCPFPILHSRESSTVC